MNETKLNLRPVLLKKVLFFLLLQTLTTPAFASKEDTEVSYDTIVSELSKVRSSDSTHISSNGDMFDTIKIHAGVGFLQSNIRLRSANNKLQGLHRGVEAMLGIDLFSSNWFAEGAIRSFGETAIEDATIQLREFDLKLIYRTNPKNLFSFKTGLGLAARNLKFTENSTLQQVSSPASILLTGVDLHLTDSLSLGGEVSWRSTMVSDSIDRSSLDLSMKVDAHF